MMDLRIVARFALVLFLAALLLGLPEWFVFAAPAAQTPVTPAIAAGENWTCALKSDGTIVCAGNASASYLTVPVPNSGFTAVDAGVDFTCGLKEDGSIVCWGSNSYGQLNVPAPNSGFTRLSVGWQNACGLQDTGSIVCWGYNASGMNVVPAPNSDFTQVSSGYPFNCGLKNTGSLVCWGDNSYGQLNIPAPNSGFTQISSDYYYNCALREDSSVVCWGANNYNIQTIPAPNSGFTQINAGRFHACGLITDGSVVCWGMNSSVQTTPAAPNSSYAQVHSGYMHTCAVKTDGAFICWGYQSFYPMVTVNPSSLPGGQYGALYSDQTLSSTGAYGAAAPYTYDVITDALPGGLTLSTAGVLGGTPTESGTFTFYARSRDANNFMGARQYTLNISQASLTITADAVQSTYGTDPVLTYTPSGFVNDDTADVLSGEPLLTTTATGESPVGSYPITISQGSLSADNYTLTFSDGGNEVTVGPATLAVTPRPVQFTYGTAPVLDGYTVTGFVNGQDDSIVGGSAAVQTAATEASPVGDHPITFSEEALTADNYIFDYQAGVLTVDPAALTVTANPVTSTYGSTPLLDSYTVTGWIFGAEPLGGTAVVTTAIGPTSPVDVYADAITFSQQALTAQNYIFTYANGDLTVVPAELTVTADDLTKPYGADTPLPDLTYTITGFANGELAEDVVTGEPLLSTTATAAGPIGEYLITIQQNTDQLLALSADNYTFTFVNGKLTITGIVLYFPMIIN